MQRLEQHAAPRSFLPTLRLLTLLAAVNLGLFALNVSGILPAYWIIGLALYGFAYMVRFGAYRTLFEDTYWLGKSLDQFRSILVFLEDTSTQRPEQLAQLCEPFTRSTKRPSKFLHKIVWITIASSLGNNPVLSVLLNAVVPWNLFRAYILSRYQQELHESLRKWLAAWYEIEALCSLANFAWLNPGYAFPALLTAESDEAEGDLTRRTASGIRLCRKTGGCVTITRSNG